MARLDIRCRASPIVTQLLDGTRPELVVDGGHRLPSVGPRLNSVCRWPTPPSVASRGRSRAHPPTKIRMYPWRHEREAKVHALAHHAHLGRLDSGCATRGSPGGGSRVVSYSVPSEFALAMAS